MVETVRRNLVVAPVAEIGNTIEPVIAPGSTVGVGLQIILAAGLRTLRNAAHRGAPERPETIHRFRVGLRRLRSLITAFRSVLPTEERRALGARLGALAKRYSAVREWDVFLAETLRPMATALPDEPALLELESCARAARQRALPEAIDFHAEANEVAEVIDAAIWLHHPRPEFADKWDIDLKDLSTELLAKHHQRLRRRLKAVDLAQQDSLHQLRIEAKKTRYPAEMFCILFDESAVNHYLARLIAVQDVLGALNDALVARNLIAELPLSSRPQGLAYGWLAREIEDRRQSVPAAAKKLRKAVPFWEE